MKTGQGRNLLTSFIAVVALSVSIASTQAADKVTLRLASVNSETDQRAIALMEKFAPAVAEFASFEPHWNGTLFNQGTELEAIATGDLEMSITSAQELATFIPEFSVFSAGYVHQDAAHQVAVFNDPLMDPFKQKVEDALDVKLLTVMYLGQRQVNLREPRSKRDVRTPADLAGVNLRMPGNRRLAVPGSSPGCQSHPHVVYRGLYRAADRCGRWTG